MILCVILCLRVGLHLFEFILVFHQRSTIDHLSSAGAEDEGEVDPSDVNSVVAWDTKRTSYPAWELMMLNLHEHCR